MAQSTSVGAVGAGAQPDSIEGGEPPETEPTASVVTLHQGGGQDAALAAGIGAIGEAIAAAAERGAWSEVQALSGALARLTAVKVEKGRRSQG